MRLIFPKKRLSCFSQTFKGELINQSKKRKEKKKSMVIQYGNTYVLTQPVFTISHIGVRFMFAFKRESPTELPTVPCETVIC